MSKLLSGFVAASMVVMMLGAVVAPAPASAATIEELQALIASLTAQIAALSGQVGSTPAAVTFTSNLTIGSRGAEVTALQNFLVAKGYLVMPAGVAPGYFGALTKSAVAAYQAAKGIAPAVGYFGPLTRAAVNAEGSVVTPAPTPGTTPGGITTPGVEGVMTVTENASPSSGLTVREGDAKVGVLGIKIKAQRSDLDVQRVKIDLGSSASIYTKIFSRIYLLDGSTVVAEMPLNSTTVVKEGSTYYAQVAGFHWIVPKDTTKVLTVAVDVMGSIDSGDQGSKTIQLANNGVRSVDGAGIDQTGPTTGSTVSNAVTVDDTLVDNATLSVSLSNATPAARQIVAADGSSNDEVSEVEIAKINAKATGDAVTITDWQVTVTESGANAGSAVTAYLYDDAGTLVGTGAISSGAATFSDIDYVVAKDTTKVFSLRIKITGLDNTAVAGFGASTTGGAVSAENSAGSTVSPTGTASTSAVVFAIDDGLEISLDSNPTISISGTNGTPAAGLTSTSTISATFNVRLKAVGTSVIIGGTSSSSPVVSTGATSTTLYLNGAEVTNISSVSTTTSYTLPTGYTVTSNSITLNDGDSVVIPVTYSIVGRNAAGAAIAAQGSTIAVQLGGVAWRIKDGAGFTSTFMDDRSEWRTGTVSL